MYKKAFNYYKLKQQKIPKTIFIRKKHQSPDNEFSFKRKPDQYDINKQILQSSNSPKTCINSSNNLFYDSNTNTKIPNPFTNKKENLDKNVFNKLANQSNQMSNNAFSHIETIKTEFSKNNISKSDFSDIDLKSNLTLENSNISSKSTASVNQSKGNRKFYSRRASYKMLPKQIKSQILPEMNSYIQRNCFKTCRLEL